MGILEMKHISKAFSGVYANEDISLSVAKGEIHALLGENGAGKTTLMNILFGIYSADQGEIFWKGEEVHFPSPKAAIESGIGMVHQHFSLVQKLSVLDNIILGLETGGKALNRGQAREQILSLAEKYGLKVNPSALVNQLSVGQQQRVEILKALYRNVDLLILDEPTGVLTPSETEHFFEVLRKLKEEGYAVIIITHRMSEIMSISDRVTILRDGKKIIDLVTAETNPAELSNYMIGRQLNSGFVTEGKSSEEKALVLNHVSIIKPKQPEFLSDICLDIKKGEVLGIAGVDGNGQKELAEVIAGVRKATEGKIEFCGEDIAKDTVKQRFKKGISYISDDRHADGLVLAMNVEENLMLRDYDRQPYSRLSFMNKKLMKNRAAAAIEDYKIKTSGTSKGDTIVRLMSGGNQQKVIVAREVSENAKLVIANQPTRGLDIGATEFVRQVLMNHRNKGGSVLLISADLEEIMALSDRIAVMFGGRIMGVLDREHVTMEKIGLMMGGITEEEIRK
ncbi:ABC transporter ATP-binding protein [Clostridium sp. AM58-1XD]|uniref:ABC transporter ATP-binding protein n=1 Tax=Clostridium sp. AM58-1XD TaxID=2292307 RepID=UPI000E502DAD|nr:ABC transporter ATP-binding protein [Clostridium sp. AM58-1XD]RGY98070.1 ABC transporter ATP-binding protein [Clostridium sp. AM58-1XD]